MIKEYKKWQKNNHTELLKIHDKTHPIKKLSALIINIIYFITEQRNLHDFMQRNVTILSDQIEFADTSKQFYLICNQLAVIKNEISKKTQKHQLLLRSRKPYNITPSEYHFWQQTEILADMFQQITNSTYWHHLAILSPLLSKEINLQNNKQAYSDLPQSLSNSSQQIPDTIMTITDYSKYQPHASYQCINLFSI